MGLPKNVRDVAIDICRRATTERPGSPFKNVAAAAVYMACRECEVTRTLNEVAESSHASKIEIARMFRLLARKLHITLPPINPSDFIPRFANKLKLGDETTQKAIKLLKEVKDKGINLNLNPVGVAAAAIYIAGAWRVSYGDRRTQLEVAEVALITVVTLSRSCKKLCEKLGLDFWGSITAPVRRAPVPRAPVRRAPVRRAPVDRALVHRAPVRRAWLVKVIKKLDKRNKT